MKLFHYNFSNDQPKSLSKRSDKKSVNIKWNSKLFFQLGLILSILVVYFLLQIKFEVKDNKRDFASINYLDEIPIISFTIDEPILIPKKKVLINTKFPKILNKEIEVVPDDATILDDPKINVPSEENPITNPTPKSKTNNTTIPKNILGVEYVPIFPGCEGLKSNLEKRNCMSSKINKFIGRKFNTDNFEDSNSSNGQKITVQFTIDINGNVTNIIARAPNKLLEREAKRVVSKLPKMKPGRQGNKPVPVQYLLPIKFKLDF